MVLQQPELVEFLSFRRIAVVGVSREAKKPGYRIYFNLKRKGYRVYAINPVADEIGGDPCYPSLSSLPEAVDVVNLVVPPDVGWMVVEECLQLGFRRIWFQPGAESESLLRFCQSHHLQVVANQCLMELSSAVVPPQQDH